MSSSPRIARRSYRYIYLGVFLLASLVTLVCGVLFLFTKHSHPVVIEEVAGVCAFVTLWLGRGFGRRIKENTTFKRVYYSGLILIGLAIISFLIAALT